MGVFLLSRDKAGESGSLPHACGGVLTLICQHRISRSLPHACGGVSCTVLKLYRAQASSPRMWGCFQGKMVTKDEYGVFPTHVGVFLMGNRVGKRNDKSSPRMWGQFSSRTTYQRRAFHALGHIQQELRDGQAPRTPDLEKPFQTIPPPGILLGGHAGSPARGRHGFKPCPFRRSGRGQRPPFPLPMCRAKVRLSPLPSHRGKRPHSQPHRPMRKRVLFLPSYIL